MMERLEIQTIDMRVVCTNHPHLRQMWLLGALTKGLGCFYNPHRPQVIWTQCCLSVPTPRIVRIKNHASHTIPTLEANVITTNIQMGTYLLFCLPKGICSNRSSCQLVLNGVESIQKGKPNPSKVSLKLIDNSSSEDKEELTLDNHVKRLHNNSNEYSMPLTKEDHCKNLSQENVEWKEHKSSNSPNSESKEPRADRVLDFEELEEVTTIAEEEDGVPSDEDDDETADDIHKVIRRRLVADINDMLTEWEKTNSDSTLFTLMLKPTQMPQAWQFSSAWISITQNNSESDKHSPHSEVKRKGLTRRKPISATSTSTLKKIPKIKNICPNTLINTKT